MDFIQSWPGKLGKASEREDEPSPSELPAYHPTAFHMLDVAAVAERILQEEPSRLQAFTTAWTVAEDDARRWIVGLIALHDLGKFSGGFLNQILDRVPKPARTTFFPHYAETRPTSKPHWQLTLPWLLHHRGILDDYLGPYLLRDRLEAAIAGHHGLPVEGAGRRNSRDTRGDIGFAPAKAFLEAWLAVIAPTPLEHTDAGELAQPVLSWHLAGLTVMADWIGSNRAWFPFATDWGEPSTWPDLQGYWPIAQERAAKALREAGASPARLAPLSDARTFLGFATKPLRPLQAALEECRIPNGPTLVLIEDLMGAGKTEAALLISRRLICQGKAEGVHIGLPTMATANALFDRIGPIARRLYETEPSLILAHSRRRFHPAFRDVEAPEPQSTADAEALGCADWLKDDRRRAFLAEIGVGTLDQSLQAVLPTKFNTLRLAGLSRRVLVCDEVHAYDSYMRAELEALLEFQSALGGSAVVMTATLPEAYRAKLIAAFQRGLGEEARAADVPGREGFPGFTIVGRAHVHSQSVDPVPETRRALRLTPVRTEADAIDTVAQAADAGASVAFIRNSVDGAVTAAAHLRARGYDVILFHARSTLGDRLAIERTVLEKFGRTGDGAGTIMVATQVAEQSLDLDFDAMVSDLAPIDLLAQRAGRLWRHMDTRPAADRPVAGPTLHVLSPGIDAATTPAWLTPTLGPGAYIYDLDIQYRTAERLGDGLTVRLPEDLPALIEGVYADVTPLPEALTGEALRADGRRRAEAAHGTATALPVGGGYADPNRYVEGEISTRLGEPSIALILGKRVGTRIDPLVDEPAEDRVLRWGLSTVTLRQSWMDRAGGPPPEPEEAASESLRTDIPALRYPGHRLAIVRPDGTLDERWHYSDEVGFRASVS